MSNKVIDQGHLEAKIAIQQIQNDLKLMKRQFTLQLHGNPTYW